MMNNFTKIQTYVKDQLDHTIGALVITSCIDGYRVNNYSIKRTDWQWNVIDCSGQIIGSYLNKRLAILAAALHVKKNLHQVYRLSNIDTHLHNLKHDITIFENMITKSDRAEVYEARYSRTSYELDGLYAEIGHLERNAGLLAH